MEAIEFLKKSLINLSNRELIELQSVINQHLKTPISVEKIKEIWVKQGKIEAIKHYLHSEHLIKPSLVEAKEYVESTCKDLRYKGQERESFLK